MIGDRDAVDTVVPAQYGELKLPVWNRDPTRPLPAEEAFAIYERNWRHVDRQSLSDPEKALIADLTARFGKGAMLA